MNGELSTHDRRMVRVYWGNRCAGCGKHQEDCTHTFHVDHWYPASKGYALTLGNAVLLCPICNMAKHDKWPWEYFDPKAVARIGLALARQTVVVTNAMRRTDDEEDVQVEVARWRAATRSFPKYSGVKPGGELAAVEDHARKVRAKTDRKRERYAQYEAWWSLSDDGALIVRGGDEAYGLSEGVYGLDQVRGAQRRAEELTRERRGLNRLVWAHNMASVNEARSPRT